MSRSFRLLLFPALAGLLGCVSAKINVVDERTALENQILGSYQELDQELLLVASVRTGAETGGHAGGQDIDVRARAIRARQVQQFNKDDIDEFKGHGCLGEGNDALLALRPCDRVQDPREAQLLARLLESENAARTTIVRFVVTTSPNLTQKDLPQVTAAYARLLAEQARPGDWIQDEQGAWKKK